MPIDRDRFAFGRAHAPIYQAQLELQRFFQQLQRPICLFQPRLLLLGQPLVFPSYQLVLADLVMAVALMDALALLYDQLPLLPV